MQGAQNTGGEREQDGEAERLRRARTADPDQNGELLVKESNNQEQEIEQERVAWSAIAGAEHPGGPGHLALQVG